jgi:predicted DCC family thiol-disulfide oxidoreductase YuxK
MAEGTRGCPSDSVAHPILLYDGVCGLCNRLVQFILRRDPGGLFRFASLQSSLAGRILARHGADAGDLDTVYLVVNAEQADEELLARSDAVIFVLRHLGEASLRLAGPFGFAQGRLAKAPVPTWATATAGSAFWRVAGALLLVVPRTVRDWGYGVIARNRYRVFGRYDVCPLPSEDTRGRFLDL